MESNAPRENVGLSHPNTIFFHENIFFVPVLNIFLHYNKNAFIFLHTPTPQKWPYINEKCAMC